MAGPQYGKTNRYMNKFPCSELPIIMLKIEVDDAGQLKTELLNNLVVMYEVEAGKLARSSSSTTLIRQMDLSKLNGLDLN